MKKRLLIIVGALVLVGIAFLRGRKRGESVTNDNTLSFITQSVDKQNASNFGISQKGTLKVYTVKDLVAREPLGKNSSSIPCPGVDSENLVMELDYNLPGKLLDGDQEVSMFGYDLALFATSQKIPVKFVKSLRKNTLVDGQCLYLANKDTIMIYTISLDSSCVAADKGFDCSSQ